MPEAWTEYYRQIAAGGDDTLDYSTRRQQQECWLAALKFAGDLFGAAVLDAGCGTGRLVAMMKLLGAGRAVGVDLTQELLDRAKQAYPDCEFYACDLRAAGTWSFGHGFDLVTCVEALHVTDAGGALEGLWRHVRPGGRLVATLWNLASPFNDADLEHPPHEPWGGLTHVGRAVERLVDVATWRVSGLVPGPDQRIEVFDSRLFGLPMPLSFVLAVVKSGGGVIESGVPVSAPAARALKSQWEGAR